MIREDKSESKGLPWRRERRVNLRAGGLGDRFGRKPDLLAGWLAAIPIPLLIYYAPGWWWSSAASALPHL
jgi:hypothetical protein